VSDKLTPRKDPSPRHAAAYVRVSTREQAKTGYSVDEQLRRLEEEAQRRRWEVVGAYADRGVTGKRESRPALDDMLRAARAGEFDVLMIVHLDRLGRTARHLLNLYEELRTVGVELIALEQNIDSTTAHGRAQLGMLAVFAEFEREMIAERVRGSNEARARRGRAHGRLPTAT